MKKSNMLKFIIFMISIIIIILVVILFYIIKETNNHEISEETNNVRKEEAIEEEEKTEIEEIDDEYKSGELKDEDIYFTLEQIVNDFYNALQNNENIKVCNMLNHIDLNIEGITYENLNNFIKPIENFVEFKADKIYKRVKNDDNQFVTSYFICGIAYSGKNNDTKEDIYMRINVDNKLNTFEINYYFGSKDLAKEYFESEINNITDEDMEYYSIPENEYNRFKVNENDNYTITIQ